MAGNISCFCNKWSPSPARLRQSGLKLHSSENDYPKNIRPRVRYHAGYWGYPFVEVANAEYNRLERDSQSDAAGDRLKLPLKVAAKNELLTKSG
jgi:hypothetical protein